MIIIIVRNVLPVSRIINRQFINFQHFCPVQILVSLNLIHGVQYIPWDMHTVLTVYTVRYAHGFDSIDHKMCTRFWQYIPWVGATVRLWLRTWEKIDPYKIPKMQSICILLVAGLLIFIKISEPFLCDLLVLLNACFSWWRHQMETFSALTGHLFGEFTGPVELPTQRPVTRSFDVFLDLRLNKRLSKQPWGWWFESLSRPLWRHRNVILCMPPSHVNGVWLSCDMPLPIL